MKRSIVPALLATALVGTAPSALDTIELADGTVLRGVQVAEQTMEKVTFEREGAEESVPSQEVVEVRFDRLPDALDEAGGLVEEGDPQGALELLEAFVKDNVPRAKTRAKWAPAYAAWRVVEIERGLSDASGVIDAADTLVASFPDSRYVPLAMLAKAEFQARQGDAEASDATLATLDDLARERGLKRWQLASQLRRLILVERDSQEKRDAIRGLAESAGDFPGVRSEARVAEAATWLEDASKAALDEAQAMRGKARTLLQQVVDDPRASGRALAGAHAGMAEVLFFEGAASEDGEVLRRAVLHGLRVGVLYRSETDLLPRALYFALRSFLVMGERGRAADLQGELEREFPDSPWTAEARKYR